MDALQKAAPREYQDFAPQTELKAEADCDTLLVYLSGFKKEQLRVQLTKTRNLIISGEHPIGNNVWRRFQKTFAVSMNCDISKITAKFEDVVLFVRMPKLIAFAEKQNEEKPSNKSTEAPSAQYDDQNKSKANGTKAPEAQKAVENEQKPPINSSPVTNPADEHMNKKDNAPTKNAEIISEKANEKDNEQKASDENSKEFNNVADKAKMAQGIDHEHQSDLSNAIKKLKMARTMMNYVLALLLAIMFGMYVKNSLSSCRKDEI